MKLHGLTNMEENISVGEKTQILDILKAIIEDETRKLTAAKKTNNTKEAEDIKKRLTILQTVYNGTYLMKPVEK